MGGFGFYQETIRQTTQHLLTKIDHKASTKVAHALCHLGVGNESQKDKDQTEVGILKKAN